MEQKQKIVKITSLERIERVITRICDANLKVLIKPLSDEAKLVSVRGAAAGVDSLPGHDKKVFRISEISEQGMGHILNANQLQVEFIGLSTKVVFYSIMIGSDNGSIHVSFPEFLVSIERRSNTRYLTTDQLVPFISFSAWDAVPDDLAAPPVVGHLAKLSSWIKIADISEGGVCVITRFPSALMHLHRGMIDDKAKLIFPLRAPLDVKVEVRWFKRIKERLNIDGATRCQRFYRIGVKFVDLSESARTSVQQFIKQVSFADAI